MHNRLNVIINRAKFLDAKCIEDLKKFIWAEQGKKIKSYRPYLGLSLRAFGAKFEVDNSNLAKMENGKASPDKLYRKLRKRLDKLN